jgi:hypothetical protein
MRFDSGPDRLYLVDTEGKAKQVELPGPDGAPNPIINRRAV